MARLLALDWDRKQLRLVLATPQKNGLRIDKAEAVPITGEEDLQEALKESIPEIGGKRATTLVSVDRGHIELLQLSLPPVSDAELPEMVANQAMLDSASITEESTLDYIITEKSNELGVKVTAASLSQTAFDDINELSEAAEFKPNRIELRPYAAAKLFELTSGIDEPCLLINVLSDSFDISVVEGRLVKFSRTIQLPEEAHLLDLHNRILAEIQRTLTVVVQEHLAADEIQRIYVLGGEENHELCVRIKNETEIDCGEYDVFQAVGASNIIISTDSGRYASLVGMLLAEAKNDKPAFDFVNPRKAPPPPNRRSQVIVGIAAAIALMVAGWKYVDNQLADLRTELKMLQSDSSKKYQMTKELEDKIAKFKNLEAWEKQNINWLDELRDLSVQFPSSRDAMIQRMSLSLVPPARGGGGQITFQGLVRDSALVDSIEQNLNDEFHKITIPRVKVRQGDKDYGWHFEASLGIDKRKPEQFLNHKEVPNKQPLQKITRSN